MNTVHSSGLRILDRAGVTWIEFDRPEVLNAVRIDMLMRIEQVLTEHRGSAVVFTGNGKAFTAGQDLNELAALDTDPRWDRDEHLRLFQNITRLLLASEVPTVAAVNGVAVGFGAELALACDVRIAADSARMGFVEVRRGLFQTNGVTWLLPRMIGHGRAADLMLSGDILDAEQLYSWGLVTRRCRDDVLTDTAQSLAVQLAAGYPVSRSWIKRSLDQTWSSDLDQMMDLEVSGMLACLDAGSAAAGAAEFLAR